MNKIALYFVLCLAGCDFEVGTENASADRIEAPSATNEAKTFSEAELQQAISSAFPSEKPLRDADGVEWTFKKHKLVETPFGPALVSEADPDIDTIGHVTSGRIDVNYLSQFGDGFSVEKRFPAAVTIGSNGTVGEWAIVSRFGELPMIYASGGFTNMGATEGCVVLVELERNGPKELVAIPDYFGIMGGDEVEGKIENILKSKGFDIRYKGKIDGKATDKVVHYVRRGDKYNRQGPPVLDHCGEE
jgi:hypothetical protein